MCVTSNRGRVNRSHWTVETVCRNPRTLAGNGAYRFTAVYCRDVKNINVRLSGSRVLFIGVVNTCWWFVSGRLYYRAASLYYTAVAVSYHRLRPLYICIIKNTLWPSPSRGHLISAPAHPSFLAFVRCSLSAPFGIASLESHGPSAAAPRRIRFGTETSLVYFIIIIIFLELISAEGLSLRVTIIIILTGAAAK